LSLPIRIEAGRELHLPTRPQRAMTASVRYASSARMPQRRFCTGEHATPPCWLNWRCGSGLAVSSKTAHCSAPRPRRIS